MDLNKPVRAALPLAQPEERYTAPAGQPNLTRLTTLPTAPGRWRTSSATLPIAIMAMLALVPLVAELVGQPFYTSLATRILIFALAATGLNLVLGYGGLVSMGHALYIGIGAYAVGILSSYGVTSGWVHLAVALAAGVAIAFIIGAICLRTSGVGFIMITLAFAQMLYFLVVGLRQFGGEDGLSLAARSDFSGLPLDNVNVLYYVVFAVLGTTVYGIHRIVHARFGMLLRGAKCNARRMGALGFPLLRYRLAAYVISAQVCVVAGLLLANLSKFVSPSYMHWTVSGELIVMVVLGGLATSMGPMVGALCILILEELLSSMPLPLPYGLDEAVRSHWLGIMGLFVTVATLAVRHGLYEALAGRLRGAK